jgi:hypothetical protein
MHDDTLTLERAMFMITLRHSIQDNTPYRFVPLLKMLRSTLATNPRDKVFAICGLAADVGPNGLHIPIDYSRSPSELYRSVAVAVLKQDSSLDLLQVSRPSCSTSVLDLPSWVPDWSKADLDTPVNKSDLDMEENTSDPYNATWGTKYVMIGNEEASHLPIEGIIVDSIVQAGSFSAQPPDVTSERNTRNLLYAQIKQLNEIASLLRTWEDTAGYYTDRLYMTKEDIKIVYV